MNSHLVFVYGTLRKGEKYSYYLNEAECLGENCTIEGQLYDTGWGYPALVCESSKIPVRGELYRVTSEQLKELDKLEGYEENGTNNLYERITVKVTTENGEQGAIVYVMTSIKYHFNRIDGNDWILR
ncbi:gamma-glutamylcyclotransferase family protein [Fictibacillus arsenicus]|uniref:Gamma-glutamylcyclotransferase family protein n=1 Tax=Fictibacillus arsenicus TaxID=255247 RepID=A0A1V3G8N3_9BACL|nr:gamma-glutamylcyclotransferase family protein [Fictibacillus arsenicus]OOE12761.1 hypothetical protein UN64_11930 [Fictibacillus arsenicus]